MTNLEKWIAKSRDWNPGCGCEQRGDRWFKCSYHEGAEDGWEVAERETCERCVEIAREIAVEVGGVFADTHILNTGLNKFITRIQDIDNG